MMISSAKANELVSPRTRLLQNESFISNKSERKRIYKTNTKFPKSIYLIIGNEFCERYSFYALRTILALYLASELSLGEDTATSVYHGWASLCFCTPLIGATIADSYIGRFKTITYISLVYILGSVTLSLSSVHSVVSTTNLQIGFSAVGLILIGFGTGGIKSCVAAFGGDQFDLPEQEEQLTKFFYVFYFAVNAGGAFSSLLTPIFREDVTCFGGDCYPLAFGVPALLMILSLGIFLAGSRLYKVNNPEGNIIGSVVSCIYYAVNRKFLGKAQASHWLDLAEDKYTVSLVHDIKCLFRVLMLLIPVPLFWTLFDQQSTRWMFQATRMRGETQIWTIKPDQIQVLNPVMILLLIPVFDLIVYPAMKNYNIALKPLSRMILGGLLTACAFFVSGIVQSVMENNAIDKVPYGKIHVEFINALPCNLELKAGNKTEYFVPSYDKVALILEKDDLKLHASVVADDICPSNEYETYFHIKTPAFEANQRILLIASLWKNSLRIMQLPEHFSYFKAKRQKGTIRVISVNQTTFPAANSKKNCFHFQKAFYSSGISVSEPLNLSPGEYSLVFQNESKFRFPKPTRVEKEVARTILLYPSTLSGSELEMKTMPWYGVELSMLWLLPQYFLISVGEMFFVITGLELVFKEAPDSMKSVVQAGWLFTVAVGNFVMMIVAELRFFNWQSHEFFLFGFLMLLDMVLFYYISRIYESSAGCIYNLEGVSFGPLIRQELEYDSMDTSEEEIT